MSTQFSGPLFIVGMSRSGTKLLRNILNNNPAVAIPTYESHFLPYLVKNFPGSRFPLSESDACRLIKMVRSSIFYGDIKRTEPDFKELDFSKLVSQPDIQSAIEYLMRKLADQSQDKSSSRIWGDKTPNYLVHMDLLKQAFPSAKFIHIVRDPRERALSAKKAWRAPLLLSAERWQQGVGVAKRQSEHIGEDYFELTYEQLVREPESIIGEVCSFVGVDYDDSMLTLSRSAEHYQTAGQDTKEATTIVKSNTSKYKRYLSATQIQRIEAICSEHMLVYGYINEVRKTGFKLTSLHRSILLMYDRLMVVAFHVQRWGLIGGIEYLVWKKQIKTTSVRAEAARLQESEK